MQQQQPKIADEMRKMHAEPLLPIEKKLISWSLGLGIALLIVLVAISRIFVHT
jgi:hypothetical protein